MDEELDDEYELAMMAEQLKKGSAKRSQQQKKDKKTLVGAPVSQQVRATVMQGFLSHEFFQKKEEEEKRRKLQSTTSIAEIPQ